MIPNIVLRDPCIDITAKCIYGILLSYAWHERKCFPGQERIAIDLGCSKRTVIRGLVDLEKRGLITILRQGQGRSNVYIINEIERCYAAEYEAEKALRSYQVGNP